MANNTPLHERVFQLKNAIRKAGFRAHGRVRMDKDGRVIMGVVVPVTFENDPTKQDVLDGISRCIAPTDQPKEERRPDLRTAEGREWKRKNLTA